ncbi:hypothetical protein GCM10022254_09760 [Actinomadura meridiana]|uniref:Uncharacterized protein n=1 Tax=Actinomadura meridiana TaxID=559626 RepID=A0ABP8BUK2_9ACTN
MTTKRFDEIQPSEWVLAANFHGIKAWRLVAKSELTGHGQADGDGSVRRYWGLTFATGEAAMQPYEDGIHPVFSYTTILGFPEESVTVRG